MSSFKYLKVNAATATNPVTQVKFFRPKKRNAFNQPMYLEISKALAESQQSSHCKALVLTGEGDYYSSGNDLSNFAKLGWPRQMSAEAKVFCQTFVDSFIDFQKPLLIACNGHAIGIPVTTMGLADIRYSVRSATFQTPFKQLAQAPEGCSSFMFPRIMGEENAHKVLQEGIKFTAEEGMDMKFVDEVFDTSEITLEATMAKAHMIANKTDSAPFDRLTLDPKMRELLKEVNDKECQILEKAWVSKECFDALDAYLSSRNKTTAAMMIRAANKTRFIWDR